LENLVSDTSFLSAFSGRRILVTGHTGFKGSWLCAWLTRLGAQVTGFSDALPSNPCQFELLDLDLNDRRGDIADHAAVRAVMEQARPEIVFHLAAQPIVRLSYDDPIGTYRTNVLGTLTLLEAVRGVGGVEALVSATTDKVYRNKEWVWSYREDDELGGSDPYSASKSCVELMTRSYCESFFRDAGPAVASVRAGNVIGGGDWAADRLVPDVVRAAFSGETLSIRNPDSTRPWQHVLDPLCGYLRTAASLLGDDAPHYDTWNFGPARQAGMSVRRIVEATRTMLPGLQVAFGQADAARHESNVLQLDSAKAIKSLGWWPVWEDEMLERTMAWYGAFYSDARVITGEQIAAYEQRLSEQD
jgi:CDP-glucose 4,6-dehydratase